jgi:hypothetical protein
MWSNTHYESSAFNFCWNSRAFAFVILFMNRDARCEGPGSGLYIKWTYFRRVFLPAWIAVLSYSQGELEDSVTEVVLACIDIHAYYNRSGFPFAYFM